MSSLSSHLEPLVIYCLRMVCSGDASLVSHTSPLVVISTSEGTTTPSMLPSSASC